MTKFRLQLFGSVAETLKAAFPRQPGSIGLRFDPFPRHVVASLDKMLKFKTFLS